MGRIDFTVSKDKKTVTFDEPIIRKITSEQAPDGEAEKFVQEALKPLLDPSLDKDLVIVNTTLDGRFFSIRTQETGLGNLVTDASKYNFFIHRCSVLTVISQWPYKRAHRILSTIQVLSVRTM